MKPTEQTKQHVISHYVQPARSRGEKLVQVRVGNVVKELGWTNRTPSVYSTLASEEFRRAAGVELIEKKGGPPSGGPSTTWQFVFRLIDDANLKAIPPGSKANGKGLESLYGVLKDVYAELGGGETYLKAERNWGPDAWQQYEKEQVRQEKRK